MFFTKMHSKLESADYEIAEANLVLIQVSVNAREENDRALDAPRRISLIQRIER